MSRNTVGEGATGRRTIHRDVASSAGNRGTGRWELVSILDPALLCNLAKSPRGRGYPGP